jgi:hypothetical protein
MLPRHHLDEYRGVKYTAKARSEFQINDSNQMCRVVRFVVEAFTMMERGDAHLIAKDDVCTHPSNNSRAVPYIHYSNL